MNHQDIIEKLGPLQKAALVSSSFGDDAFEGTDIPAPAVDRLDDPARTVSCASAARAWNAELFSAMVEEVAREQGAEGARLVVTPNVKTAIDPYGGGLAEDACLCGTLGAAAVRGIKRAGLAAGVSRLCLPERDTAWLDRREDPAAVHDLVVKPFLQAAAECDAIFASPVSAGSGYRETNRMLFADAAGGRFGNAFVVGENVPPFSTSLTLLNGRMTLGGARIAVESAVRRCRRLEGFVAEGSVPESDLTSALRSGTALTASALDEAADGVADFAFRLDGLTPEGPAGETARKKIAEESIVLLRNRRALPLAGKCRIAVIGEAYEDLGPLERRFTVVGRARGYDRAEERSDPLIPEAVRATKEAETVLVFLYPDGTGRSLSLPANRIALLDALKRTGKKIVALICGDTPVDPSFDEGLAALLVVPADGPYAAEALARILRGETGPSGRLTRTMYDGADAYFRGQRSGRDAGTMRIGGFVGYLRYDTAEENVRYPFGYGLGYASFAYSQLTVEGNDISFTLSNQSNFDGSEVVQLYIGAPSSSRVVPKKQLAAFRKIFLPAGGSTRVTFTLTDAAFASFDPRTLTESVEGGIYRIYVCASALDVKLQGKRTVEGETRAAEEGSPADYFPGAETEDTEEVKRESRISRRSEGNVPTGLRIARKAAVYALPAVAFVFFFLATILIFSYALDFALFSSFDEDAAQWTLYAIAVGVLAVVPLLLGLNLKRLSRLRTVALAACPLLLVVCFVLGYLLSLSPDAEAERIALRVLSCLTVSAPLAALVAAVAERELRRSGSGANRWEKYYFEQVQEEQHTTSDTEFEEAFRAAEAERAAQTVPEPEEAPPAEIPQFYDKHLTYAVMLRDCKQFAEERGVSTDEGTLRNWIAALSSTPLLFVPEGEAATLCSAVAEYFGRKPYLDNAAEYTRAEDLYSRWKQAERTYVQTGFGTALEAAKREPFLLHTVLIRHAEASNLLAVFSPVAEVIARRKTALSLPDGEAALPSNLRIVVCVEGGTLKIPEALAEVGATLLPKCKEGTPAKRHTVVQSVGFERFAAMQRTVREEFPLSEGIWKNVDRLDERCKRKHVGNLLWLKTELHASVAVACGGSEADALDGAVAAELLEWLAETWDGEELMDTVADIFGKGMKLCKETYGARGAKEGNR